jgi:hypothetical protein
MTAKDPASDRVDPIGMPRAGPNRRPPAGMSGSFSCLLDPGSSMAKFNPRVAILASVGV